MSDFLTGLLIGYLLAGVSIGAWAFFEVKSWRFDSIKYRQEVQAFLKSNNKIVEGMEKAGFLVYEAKPTQKGGQR